MIFHPDFLLQSPTARELYHENAEGRPIIDYHCHLDPAQIANDHKFHTITELWLGGDHYKWRAMRANGIDERYITGDATDWEKFQKWAETMPRLLRNPLYHWTHMELHTAFGIRKTLSPATARGIYDECNEKLKDLSALKFMKMYNVEVVCTTDDPLSDLAPHRKIVSRNLPVKVLPTWRPDRFVFDSERKAGDAQALTDQLSALTGVKVTDFNTLLKALRQRMLHFRDNGCLLADHGIEGPLVCANATAEEANGIIGKLLKGKMPSPSEMLRVKWFVLVNLLKENASLDWAQQLHIGPLRNTRTKLMRTVGPDAGADTMGESTSAQGLAGMLDWLDERDSLARTILYNANPTDNAMMACMIGNFQDGTVPGKMQWGAPWWFNDHRQGIESHLDTLSSQGLLSRFVGMLTDSRSFVSYPRHDYFRRILCNTLAQDIEQGLIPRCEMPRVAQMVEDICYNNAKAYFKF